MKKFTLTFQLSRALRATGTGNAVRNRNSHQRASRLCVAASFILATFVFSVMLCSLSGGSGDFRPDRKWKIVLSILFSANRPPRVTWLAVMPGLTMLFTHQGKVQFHQHNGVKFRFLLAWVAFCKMWTHKSENPDGKMSACHAKLPLMYLIVLRKHRKVFFLPVICLNEPLTLSDWGACVAHRSL